MRAMLVAVLIATMAFSGCRESEQNRPTSHIKGVYSGVADEKLGDDTRRALQERAASLRN